MRFVRSWIFTVCLCLSPWVGLLGVALYLQHAEATVNEVTAANRYTANGSTTSFSYTFKIYANTDIEVLVDSTTKLLTTDYTVSGVGASGGGTVTFLSAPANASIVTLIRKQPAQQVSSYATGEAFPASRIEKDLDKLVMQVQQLKERVDRALVFGKKSTQSGVVDEPTEGYFARSKTGGGIDWATVTSSGSLTTPISVGNGGTGATSSASALTNLGALPLAGGTLTGLLTVDGRVKFPATQNASSDANTLDDYEEGTWTPSLGGSTTYSIQSGNYLKIGRHVTVWLNLGITTQGTGSTTDISGFPFATSVPAQGTCFFLNSNTAVVNIVLYINGASTIAQTYAINSAGASMTLTGVFHDTTSLQCTMTYLAQN